MKRKIDVPTVPTEIDEVERCRRVRRTLERKHKNLVGLGRWLGTLQKQRDQEASQKKKRKR